MAQELRPNQIREANLNRRLRGYDVQQTEQLLADVAESYEKVLTEREALSEQLEAVRDEQAERERGWRLERERLSEQLSDREGRVSDLEADIAGLKEESNQLERTSQLTDELVRAQAAKAGEGPKLAEHDESIAWLETRERALLEQIEMLDAQLERPDETGAAPADRRTMANLEERAARTLLRLDRLVERAERETRGDTQITLKKARERAEAILHSAGTQRQPSGEGPIQDPANGGPVTDGADEEIGEAAWTSRIRSDRTS